MLRLFSFHPINSPQNHKIEDPEDDPRDFHQAGFNPTNDPLRLFGNLSLMYISRIKMGHSNEYV